MERKWEQRILPPIPLKLCTKHSLGQTECMSQMQMSITVRIGEGDNELFLLVPIVIVDGITLKGLFTFPHGLNFHLGGAQSIALGGSLGSGADGEVGHLGGWRSGWCHCCSIVSSLQCTLKCSQQLFVSPAVTFAFNSYYLQTSPLLPSLLNAAAIVGPIGSGKPNYAYVCVTTYEPRRKYENQNAFLIFERKQPPHHSGHTNTEVTALYYHCRREVKGGSLGDR